MNKPFQLPIVFFDGVCNLCNFFIRWLIDHDRSGIHRIASLQGETADKMLGPQLQNAAEWSIVLMDDDGVHRKSRAVFKIFSNIGGIWKQVSVFLSWMPVKISDGIYDFVARNRYRWFGKRETCRVPTAEGQERFLP